MSDCKQQGYYLTTDVSGSPEDDDVHGYSLWRWHQWPKCISTRDDDSPYTQRCESFLDVQIVPPET